MSLDEHKTVLYMQYKVAECGVDGAAACGTCAVCCRRASLRVGAHVLDHRYTRRGRTYENSGPEERRYVQNRTLLLLDMLGLAGDASPDPEVVGRSEWGRSMRGRQLP